jgi:hypothetical protein
VEQEMELELQMLQDQLELLIEVVGVEVDLHVPQMLDMLEVQESLLLEHLVEYHPLHQELIL